GAHRLGEVLLALRYCAVGSATQLQSKRGGSGERLQSRAQPAQADVDDSGQLNRPDLPAELLKLAARSWLTTTKGWGSEQNVRLLIVCRVAAVDFSRGCNPR